MKVLRIPEPSSWRPDARSLYHFGDYRIPADMSEELAARAIADGVGMFVDAKLAEPPAETKIVHAGVKSAKAKAGAQPI